MCISISSISILYFICNQSRLMLQDFNKLTYFTYSCDLISSELSALRLVAATANWVASQRTTQFAVAATDQTQLR